MIGPILDKAVRELKFPKIPNEIIDNLSKDYDSYKDIWSASYGDDLIYRLTDSHSEELNKWCKANICESIHWEFQIITGDTVIHRDNQPYSAGVVAGFPQVKFVYQLSIGGDNVLTEIYNEIDLDQFELAETYKFELHTWYLFNVQRWHRVVGIKPGMTRFAVVGHVF